jgi:two-component system OmpR family sensor kinase
MKHLSVRAFIHILFLVAFVFLVVIFLLLKSWDKDREKIDEFKRYQLISISMLSKLETHPNSQELKDLLSTFHLKLIDKKLLPQIRDEIAKRGKTIYDGGSNIGQMRVFKIGKDKKYIYIQKPPYDLMLVSVLPPNYYKEIAISVISLLVVLLLFIYWAILKKLKPLKTLHQEIEKFANGDSNVQITYKYNDEIGKIAKSFDDAIVYINQLSQSKNLFMRNMMHELKTPITKGRIAVEMIDDEATKAILIRAFERMNELINELASLERVASKSFEPTFEYLILDEIVEYAQELLMNTQNSLEIDIEPMVLTTDKKLLALAIKNLIDNGFKYGKENYVRLQTNNGNIEILSKGDRLEYDLSYYTEPFSQAEKRSAGFGLGLYIVNNIVKKLGYELSYEYRDGYNVFVIITSLVPLLSNSMDF